MNVRTLKIDITPSVEVELCGFAIRNQPSTFKHDNLFCKVLFLGVGEDRIVLMQFDLIGFNTSYSQKFRERLSSFLKLPVSHIQIFASHTHSGPCSLNLNACGKYDQDYLVFMEGQVFSKLSLEMDNPQIGKDCSPEWFETRVGLGMNRRSRLQSGASDKLGVLSFQDSNGDYFALLVNYPMHPVCLSDQGISADYPGRLAAILGEELPGNPEVLFGLGPCGDIDPPGVGVSYDQMLDWSQFLARQVLHLLVSAGSEKNGITEIRQSSISWPMEIMDEQQIDSQEEIFLSKKEGFQEFGDNYQLAVELWRKHRKADIEGGASTTIKLSIDQIRIGSLNLVFLNAELFSFFTDLVRAPQKHQKSSPKLATDDHYCLITCANGVVGYLPDLEQYQTGGYEVETSHIFYDSFRIVPGALEKIAEELLRN